MTTLLVNPGTLQFFDAIAEEDFARSFCKQLRLTDFVWGCFVAVNAVQVLSHAWSFETILFWSVVAALLPRLVVSLISLMIPCDNFPRFRPIFLRLQRAARILPHVFVPLSRATAPMPCKMVQLYLMDFLFVPVIQSLLYQPLFHDFVWLHVAFCACMAVTAITSNGACSNWEVSRQHYAAVPLCQSIERSVGTAVTSLDVVSTATTSPLIFLINSPHPKPHALRPHPCRGFLIMCAALQLSFCIPIVAAMQWRARVQYIKARCTAPPSPTAADRARQWSSGLMRSSASSVQTQQWSGLFNCWFPPGFPLAMWLAPGLVCLAAWPVLGSWV